MANDRFADDITLNHLIKLQKRIAEADQIAENALDGISMVHRKRLDLEDRVRQAEDTVSRLNGALNDITYLIRNEPDAVDLLARILGIADRAKDDPVPTGALGPTNSNQIQLGAIGANGGSEYDQGNK